MKLNLLAIVPVVALLAIGVAHAADETGVEKSTAPVATAGTPAAGASAAGTDLKIAKAKTKPKAKAKSKIAAPSPAPSPTPEPTPIPVVSAELACEIGAQIDDSVAMNSKALLTISDVPECKTKTLDQQIDGTSITLHAAYASKCGAIPENFGMQLGAGNRSFTQAYSSQSVLKQLSLQLGSQIGANFQNVIAHCQLN